MPALFTIYIIRYFEMDLTHDPKLLGAVLYSIPVLTCIQILLDDPSKIAWESIQVLANNQVFFTPGPLGKIAIGYNYLMKLVTVVFFGYRFFKGEKTTKTRTIIFLFATTAYGIVYAIDLYHLSPINLVFSCSFFNIISSGIMLISPEKMYKRDVLPVVNNLVIENMSSPVLVVDHKKKLLYINEKTREILGIDSIVFLQDSLKDIFEPLASYLENVNSERGYLEFKDRIYQVRYYDVEDWRDSINTVIYVLVDVTDLVNYTTNLENLVEEKTSKLLEAEKMATLGEMTTMIGHDLRNPLQVLKFICNTMTLRLGNDSQFSDIVCRANSNVIYMDKIVSDLQYFSRGSDDDKIQSNLLDLVNIALKSVNVSDDILIETDPDNLDKDIWVEKESFVRVLINLLTNAVQSIEGKTGIVWVKHSIEPGYDIVFVKDTGEGINSEDIDDLFKPFYTTKAKGMGLGLTVCKNIIEGYGGSILAESKEGFGSCFTIRIPNDNQGSTEIINPEQPIFDHNTEQLLTQ
jgi:signal transduction histidine kinase